MINENPQVKFYFVSVWMMGRTARDAEQIRNRRAAERTILGDPGPRRGEKQDQTVRRFTAELDSVDWIYKAAISVTH